MFVLLTVRYKDGIASLIDICVVRKCKFQLTFDDVAKVSFEAPVRMYHLISEFYKPQLISIMLVAFVSNVITRSNPF